MSVLTYLLLKKYFTAKFGKIFLIILLVSIALTFPIAGFVYSPLRDYMVILFIMAGAYVLLLLYILKTISLEHFVRNSCFLFYYLCIIGLPAHRACRKTDQWLSENGNDDE